VATNPFLTTQDVAERFHVTPSTVARWVRLGYIEAFRLPTGKRSHLRFEPAAVDDFAARIAQPEAATA
jgi:excisionase family DNA binding protein